MIPGHPYATEELDELRSTQRRIRQVIEDDTSLAQYSWAEPKGVNLDGDLVRREHAFRITATNLLEPHKEYLAESEARQVDYEIRRVLSRVTGGPSIDASVTRLSNRSVANDPSADRDRTKDLRDAVLLLQIADLLAGQQDQPEPLAG